MGVRLQEGGNRGDYRVKLWGKLTYKGALGVQGAIREIVLSLGMSVPLMAGSTHGVEDFTSRERTNASSIMHIDV
jgi:hypothetical protein